MKVSDDIRFFVFMLVLMALPAHSFTQPPIGFFDSLSIDIHLRGQNILLGKKDRISLDAATYRLMNANDSVKIRIEGHGAPDEESQQLSWDKIETVLEYFKGKGIDSTRFLLLYGMEGDPNKINIRFTKEEGPYWIPAPIPCYSLHLSPEKRCVDKQGNLRH